MDNIYRRKLKGAVIIVTVFFLSLAGIDANSSLYSQNDKDLVSEEKAGGGFKALWSNIAPGRKYTESLKADVEKKNSQINALSIELSQQKDEYQDLVNNYDNLRQEYSKLTGSIKQKDSSIADLNKRITELGSQIKGLISSKEDLETRLRAKEEALARLEESYAPSRKEIEGLKRKLTQSEKNLKALNQDINKKLAQIETQTKELSHLKKNNQLLSTGKKKLNESIKDKERAMQALKKEINHLDSKQKKLLNPKKKLEAYLRSKEDEFRQLKNSYSQSIKERKVLRKEIARLKKAPDALKANIRKKDAEIKDITQQLTQLKDRDRILSAEKGKVDTLLKNKEKDLALLGDSQRLLKSIKEKESLISDLKEELVNLMAVQKAAEKDQKVKLLLANIEKLFKEKKRIENELEKAHEENKRLSEVIKGKEGEVTGQIADGDLIVKAQYLERENEKLRAESHNLKNKLDSIYAEHQIKIQEAEQLKNEISLANLEIDDLSWQARSRQKLLDASENVTSDLRYKAQTLERQIHNLTIEKDAIKKDIDREKLKMHYNLAVYYDSAGLYEEAEREYLKAVSIDPADADVHYNLGILYDDALNDNSKAIYHYKRFLQLRPKASGSDKVKAWILRAESDERLGKLAPEMLK